MADALARRRIWARSASPLGRWRLARAPLQPRKTVTENPSRKAILLVSVADPGCLDIPDPNFFHPGSRI
jgi:hypothetical protein